MYTAKVMDHFEHPRNVGEIENPSGMGTVGNPKCGDIMRIYLDIDDNQVIPVKVHCSLLAEEAIHAALWDYAQKKGITIEGLEKPKDNIEEEEEEEDY